MLDKVRTLFHQELLYTSSFGICLVPEYICQVMTQSILLAGWIPIFYKVKPFDYNLPLLSINTNYLKGILAILRGIVKNIAIIIAPPWGYVDIELLEIMEICKFLHITIHLDLSQSYGTYTFEQEIEYADVIYLSFNGKKLINCGGALMLSGIYKEDNYKKLWQYFNIQAKIIECNFSSIVYNNLKIFQSVKIAYEKNNYFLRSNCTRTALYGLDDMLKNLLQEHGLGQRLLKFPQSNLMNPSNEYHTWFKNSFLIFPQPRKLK